MNACVFIVLFVDRTRHHCEEGPGNVIYSWAALKISFTHHITYHSFEEHSPYTEASALPVCPSDIHSRLDRIRIYFAEASLVRAVACLIPTAMKVGPFPFRWVQLHPFCPWPSANWEDQWWQTALDVLPPTGRELCPSGSASLRNSLCTFKNTEMTIH